MSFIKRVELLYDLFAIYENGMRNLRMLRESNCVDLVVLIGKNTVVESLRKGERERKRQNEDVVESLEMNL